MHRGAACVIIVNKFRQMRRYLAYRPDEEGRMFRLLDHAAGSPRHGPVHLLISEIGSSWDTAEAGWMQLLSVSGKVLSLTSSGLSNHLPLHI